MPSGHATETMSLMPRPGRSRRKRKDHGAAMVLISPLMARLHPNVGGARLRIGKVPYVSGYSPKAFASASAMSGTTCARTASPFSAEAALAEESTPVGGIGRVSKG